MSEHWDIYADWNPWHGCTKISPGCKYCYVYRQDEMYGSEIGSNIARKTAAFNLPLKRRRDKSYKIPSGRMVFTCFTSDFLLQDADAWRSECWAMMRERSDLWFYFFTKRIDRFMECIPPDWGDGYGNVLVGCTVENQTMADYRLPILGREARPCHYDWVLDLRRQCVEKGVPFRFHQTGARFVKDGKMYYVRRPYQLSQAHKANIDYRIGRFYAPETARWQWSDDDYTH